MKTKLRIPKILLAALLAFSLVGLSACGCSTAQNLSGSESSSFSVDEGASTASDHEVGLEETSMGSSAVDSSSEPGSISNEAPQTEGMVPETSANAPETKPSTISVSVSIQSSNAGDRSFGSISRSVSLNPGATAYDALVATGVSVGGSSSYVTSINGLSEKSCGPSSGWTYYVNGAFLTKPANRAKLENGDSVTWLFVVSPDDRL